MEQTRFYRTKITFFRFLCKQEINHLKHSNKTWKLESAKEYEIWWSQIIICVLSKDCESYILIRQRDPCDYFSGHIVQLVFIWRLYFYLVFCSFNFLTNWISNFFPHNFFRFNWKCKIHKKIIVFKNYLWCFTTTKTVY